jgi:phosphoribosylanthranilate isomerase
MGCAGIDSMELCGRANMSVIVKICGMTNLPDALQAAEAGADALGFIFAEGSPRQLTVERAAEIIRGVPMPLVKVGVFVDASEDMVLRAIGECGFNILQFHGSEAPEYCQQFGMMTMKAFRMRDEQTLAELPKYQTDAWLLDAWSPAQAGGTGERFNWDLAVTARKLGRPIFLAGGLTAENVGDAIRQVQPYAVDVSSGVEAAPGKKDHDKVSAFIRAAKAAAAEAEPA